MKKKLIAITACIVLGLFSLLCFAGCTDDNGKTKVRLCEVTHSIFYAPMYLAMNNGYFDEVGISIQLSNGGGADKVMTAIASNSADIGLMGPEATI